MRKRRDSNLKLSSEMLRLADSYFKRRCSELDDEFRMNLPDLKRQFIVSRNHLIIDRAYRDLARGKVQARIETFLEAYKSENLIPGDNDINEISWELQDIILNVSPELSVAVKAMLEKEAMRIIEAARADIRIFIQEQELERKNAEAQKTEPPSSVHYNINIGENHGPIQQGGSRNIQSTNRSDDETE